MATQFTIKAVSASTPRNQSMHGGDVRTAIVRPPNPPSKPLVVTTDGIDGNQPAIHNAQVYAMFAHHYDLWASRLGIDRADWDWCRWGENLTVRVEPEMDESAVRVGDVWRFGSGSDAVELEVVGARVPCNRLAWRLGQPDAWLQELADTGTCGIYLKVRTGGELRAGEAGHVARSAADSVPVARISQMAFANSDSPANRATITQLLQLDGLQSMNRTVLQRKLDLFRDKEMKAREGWKGWRELRVQRTHQESSDIRSFYLRPTDGKPIPPYSPGQFLTIKLPMPGEPVRCWTISQWGTEERVVEYRLSIKKAGAASDFLFSQLLDGAPLLLQARAPAGTFVVDRDSFFPKRQVYVSAGIGITPTIAMLQAHLQNDGLKKTPAICVHVTRNSSTLVFPEFLRSLPSKLELRLFLFYTKPLETDKLGQDYDVKGRPDAAFWKELLIPEYLINPLGITGIPLPGKSSDVYLCGPTPFEDETRRHLKEAGIADVLIKSESFAGASSNQSQDAPEGLLQAKLRFTKSEKDLDWMREDNLSILEIAEQAGLDLPKGCESGICGTCAVNVLKGCTTGGEGEDGVGSRICIARPATEIVEIEA